MNNLTSPGEASHWQDTELWRLLQKKEPSEVLSVITTLNQCMPSIQKVLALGETAPSDFTLHDSGHAFRVAQRMVQIIPANVLPKLSSYEVALLLFSAYLHDIGMTPERKKVTLHHNYLLTGDLGNLSEEEIKEFQRWLDDEGHNLVPPLSREPYTVETLRLADEIITYYCRHRHNDWSEEWIRKNLSGYKLGTYAGWIDDLVTLCCSHHYSYFELIQEKFNPRPVGSPAVVVHLRYLGCVLRIADILEFDPERTPEVILRHRDVSSGSLIYWYKDHQITLLLEGNRLIIAARSPSAHIHRALEVMVDQIDEELRLCRRLADETHFEKCPGLQEDLPHRWDLSSSVHRDIFALEGTYDYINGAFRPDTKKLLTLLSGVNLYGTPLAAIRELLQNAFDAIRERMAWQRLAQPNPCDWDLVHSLESLNRVELRLDTSSDGVWLICSDTGVGMTKAIIRDHLLVSGTARRHDIQDIERRCKAAGFPLGRTGQFGIGVLSYFMLANRVVIRTRRSQEPGDTEPHGWRFETEGVGSFGELRRDSLSQSGTEIHLRLRPEILKDDNLTVWFKTLREYLQNTLHYIPCEFRLKSDLPDCETLIFKAGWILGGDYLTQMALAGIQRRTSWRAPDETPAHLLSIARQQEREAENRHWKEVQAEAQQCLRWMVREGDLPEGLGRFRIHFPYFELPSGVSLGFMRVHKNNRELFLERIGKGWVYVPHGQVRMGWKGMRWSDFLRGHPRDSLLEQSNRDFPSILEINWNSNEAGEIAVNRNQFTFSEKAQTALILVKDQIRDIRRSFLQMQGNSAYATLNYRIVGGEVPTKIHWKWLTIANERETEKAKWGPLTFPVLSSLSFVYGALPHWELKWKGKSIPVIRCLSASDDGDHYKGLSWNSYGVSPDCIVKYIDYRWNIFGLWTQKPKPRRRTHAVGMICQFPPRWPLLCGVVFENFYGLNQRLDVWNPVNPLLHVTDSAAWEWSRSLFKDSLDPLPQKGEILMHRSRAAAWILQCLSREEKDLWDGLKDRDPSFLPEVWRLLFGSLLKLRGSPGSSICQWVQQVTNRRLRVLTPEGWSICKNEQDIERYLPDPGPEWCIKEDRPKNEDYERILRLVNVKAKRKSGFGKK